jgi:hypothetical protein
MSLIPPKKRFRDSTSWRRSGVGKFYLHQYRLLQSGISKSECNRESFWSQSNRDVLGTLCIKNAGYIPFDYGRLSPRMFNPSPAKFHKFLISSGLGCEHKQA